MKKFLLGLACVLTAALLCTGAFIWILGARENQLAQSQADLIDTLIPTEETQDMTHTTMDFEILHRVNSEIVGWLILHDTPVSYPVMQAADNEYYLTRTADNRESRLGGLFLDYRANADFPDFSQVIYGHDTTSGRMFGGLKNFREKDYFDTHTSGLLYTPDGTYQLEIIAVAVTDAASGYYDYSFASPAQRQAHMEMIRETALHFREGTEIETDSRLLVLSTCSYEFDSARTVVIMRLV